MRVTSAALLAAGAMLLPVPVQARQNVPLDGPGWDRSGEVSSATVDGRSAMRLRTGRAIRRDVVLEDGTIDVDVRMPRLRAFVYLQFRMQNDREHEEIYLRPHKSGLPDAVQYSPVIQGASYWQMYHGPGGTAAVEFPVDRWVRVRLVLSGPRAALFVGDTLTPVLVAPRLGREPAEGYLALRSFQPAGSPDDPWPATYANLLVRPGYIPFDFSGVTEPAPAAAGAIERWQLSPAFAPDSGPVRSPPAVASWTSVPADPGGLVMLGRHVAVPAGVRRPATAARVILRADREGPRAFDFAYSDEVSVFLNGSLLYSGNMSYSYDEPRREGLIALGQETLYLPLRRGENELIMVVSETFGGWGLMARLPDGRGVEVVTPR